MTAKTDPLRLLEPHDHIRIEGCYRCVWPDGESAPLSTGSSPEVTQTTTDMAARLYERWRQGMDFYVPGGTTVERDDPWDGTVYIESQYSPRPVWRLLDTVQQNIWRAVALEATSVTAEALADSQTQA